ncbi:MAG: regulatory protein RecX, partial [Nitriliruptorales bacterium]|nr:regulatory protein RecX [Nitriliruptorales bacterium]
MSAQRSGGSETAPARGEVDAVGNAVTLILRSTQHRPQTEAELRAKLAAREVPNGIAEAALDRARAAGAVDDAAFAAAWVEDRGRRRG